MRRTHWSKDPQKLANAIARRRATNNAKGHTAIPPDGPTHASRKPTKRTLYTDLALIGARVELERCEERAATLRLFLRNAGASAEA